jgi:hypothetical protein
MVFAARDSLRADPQGMDANNFANEKATRQQGGLFFKGE